MEPLDLENKVALEFVLEHLPPPPTRVLEIGCGSGELAGALVHRGHAVRALEPKEDAVRLARAHDVDAIHASFPDDIAAAEEGAPYDTVLYFRSLHHMQDLDSALATSRRLLKPGGLLLVDDWAWEEMDVATMAWFTSTLDLAASLEWFELPEWPRGPRTMEWWREQREDIEGAQPFHRELAALRDHFALQPVEPAPFFYRYVWRALHGRPEAEHHARAFLEHERELIASGTIRPLGRRLVGHALPS